MRLVRCLVVFVVAASTACGASIQALYEGDVRFEHCMALDARPDVKPTIRRACWQEWNKFYTYGQTRDRVDYALLRASQLARASDFDEGEWRGLEARRAVPEPTSVLAPPPMMLVQKDGGSTSDGGSQRQLPPPVAPEEKPPPSSDCTAECEETWGFCRHECTTPACERVCTGKYKRCMRRCF